MGFPFFFLFKPKNRRLTLFCVPMVTLDHQEGADTILAIWQSNNDKREAYYLPHAFGVSYINHQLTQFQTSRDLRPL